MTQTIFACATGPGPAGVAVIRVSGAHAGRALQALAADVPPPRRAALRRLHDRHGTLLDTGLVLFFPGPHSFTGEDVAELQVHGGPTVVEAVLQALADLDGLRPAEPGEFTRRAFDHGRLDLTQVEALADLIAAETPAQRLQALTQLDGHLGQLYERWRATLMRALAHLEAALDFSDEDLPEDLIGQARGTALPIGGQIRRHLGEGDLGERIRDGFTIAIAGPPNAGKSSLLNRLARTEAAIVSPIAGTTRDIVRVRLNLAGLPVDLLDLAGLRDSADPIEQEGVRRARAAMDRADLVIRVVDAADTGAAAATEVPATKDLWVAHKADLARLDDPRYLPVSSKTGEGLEALMAAIAERLAAPRPDPAQPVLTRARHRYALTETAAHLDRFAEQDEPVLAAEDLRLAVRALGRLTGRVDVDDLLDVIFSDFCIGK
ncbi:MAG: tRNA uridine-5-carboxymethylaminomethyl(34) synthesis GTPase MnmE [Rhodothalassiaceae bacterium]